MRQENQANRKLPIPSTVSFSRTIYGSPPRRGVCAASLRFPVHLRARRNGSRSRFHVIMVVRQTTAADASEPYMQQQRSSTLLSYRLVGSLPPASSLMLVAYVPQSSHLHARPSQQMHRSGSQMPLTQNRAVPTTTSSGFRCQASHSPLRSPVGRPAVAC